MGVSALYETLYLCRVWLTYYNRCSGPFYCFVNLFASPEELSHNMYVMGDCFSIHVCGVWRLPVFLLHSTCEGDTIRVSS